MRVLFQAVVIVAALTNKAQAGEVFKCRARDGGLIYQDRECAADTEKLEAPVLTRVYVTPAIDNADPERPAASPPGPTTVTRVRLDDPLLQMYRCTSPDGSSYVNATPTPRGRYVPLWTLGVGSTGFGLANGAVDARAGGQYTYVEDTCRAMPRGELCGWWKQRANETGSERRHAFKDRRAVLDQEYAGARDAIARFCR